MNIQEIIDLLEKPGMWHSNQQPLIDQVLTLLKQPKCKTCGGTGLPKIKSPGAVCPNCQQPPAGEWTKEMRKNYKYAIDNKLCVSAYVFNEACKRLDRAEAINKDLLEACEIGLNKAIGISVLAEELGTPITQHHEKEVEKIKAAIAKAKKEG